MKMKLCIFYKGQLSITETLMGWRNICENQDYGKISPQDVFTFFPCSHSCSILVTQSPASRSMSQIPCVLEPPEQKWLRFQNQRFHPPPGWSKSEQSHSSPLVPTRPEARPRPPALCRPLRSEGPPPARCVSAQPDNRAEGGTWERAPVPTPEAQKALAGRRQQPGQTDRHRPTVQRSSTDAKDAERRPGPAVPLLGTQGEAAAHTHPRVHSRAPYNTPDPGTAQAPTSGRPEQEDAPPERHSAAGRRAPLPLTATRQDLENVMLSEVRQRKTDTVRPHSRAESNKERRWTCMRNRSRLADTENTPVVSEGEKREGENRGHGTNRYKRLCIQWISNKDTGAAQEVTAFIL